MLETSTMLTSRKNQENSLHLVLPIVLIPPRVRPRNFTMVGKAMLEPVVMMQLAVEWGALDANDLLENGATRYYFYRVESICSNVASSLVKDPEIGSGNFPLSVGASLLNRRRAHSYSDQRLVVF